jgi:hypothetical protein
MSSTHHDNKDKDKNPVIPFEICSDSDKLLSFLCSLNETQILQHMKEKGMAQYIGQDPKWSSSYYSFVKKVEVRRKDRYSGLFALELIRKGETIWRNQNDKHPYFREIRASKKHLACWPKGLLCFFCSFSIFSPFSLLFVLPPLFLLCCLSLTTFFLSLAICVFLSPEYQDFFVSYAWQDGVDKWIGNTCEEHITLNSQNYWNHSWYVDFSFVLGNILATHCFPLVLFVCP